MYLSGLEDTSAPVLASSWLDSYEVGPNGFIRPRFEQHDADVVTLPAPDQKAKSPKSSFSAVGNKAATPGKAKVVQGRGQARQLISGRNFRDILEASRPRVLGASIPSALASILSLKRLSSNSEVTGDELPSKNCHSAKESSLRVWGTVDFQDLPTNAMSRSRRGGSPSPSILRGSAHSHSRNSFIEMSQSSDDGSNSSRYTDSPVSSQYGTSYDRLFWEYYKAPKTPKRAFRIQRSRSLEFDKFGQFGNESGVEGDDSVSIATDVASKGSLGGDSDTNESQKSKSGKLHTGTLRMFMDKYDGMVCGPSITKDPNLTEVKPQWSGSIVLGEPSELSSTPKAGALTQNLYVPGYRLLCYML